MSSLKYSPADEFMGPLPCIGGFLIHEGRARILFYDKYLQVAWSEDDTWEVDAEFDETVHSWIPIPMFHAA